MFNVPRYQREYTWAKRDWENLFDDISDNDKGYFLGSIIVIDHGYNAEKGVTQCELIDGQQRLTTVSLLLAALYDQLSKHKDDAEEDEDEVNVELINLKNRLIMKKSKGQTRVVPQVQGQNLQDYRALMGERVSNQIKDKRPKYAGNRKIYKAYAYFESRLEAMVEAPERTHPNNAYEAFSNFLDKVLSAVIVQISVSNASEAYTLFESLNNRGQALSAVDLIKNTLLSSFKDATEEDLDDHFNQWQRMLSLLGEDYKTQERFFRQAYAAFRREVNKPFITGTAQYPLGAVATRSNLLHIYEKQIKNDAAGMLDWLLKNAEEYTKIALVDTDGISGDLEESLMNLSRIQGVPSYVLLLHLMRRADSLSLTDQHLVQVNDLLVKFFVRRNLTDAPPTRDLTRIFINIVEGIEDEKKTGDDLVQFVRAKLLAVSADDNRFAEMLAGPLYESNPDTARFILTSLATPSVTKEMKGLWERVPSGTYVWTIEHVLPQGKNLPDAWVTMIAGGDKALAAQIQNDHVHELGNLTLTGYNSTLSNLSFQEKKLRKDKDGNSVGYLNGLNINSDIASRNDWDEAAITARTAKLVKEVIQLFTLSRLGEGLQ